MVFDRSRRPSSSEGINFKSPDIQNFTLKNGLKIFLSEKNDLPIIRINFLVNSGSRFDPDDKKGLSNLLTMCIDEGAGEYNALQLADKFEMLGAQFSAVCNEDVSIISLQVLSENFVPALKLMSDIITLPHFEEDDFLREKNKILVRLNQSKAEPDYIADIAFEYYLFGEDSPYAFPVTGIERTVQNIQVETIKSVYKNNFAPMNSTMVVVGNISQALLQKELTSALVQWENASSTNTSFSDNIKSRQKIFLIDKSNAVQTEIRTGYLSEKRNESDYFHKQVINLTLGGQFSSRLNSNLREKNGYTYGVHSQFSYLKEAGYFAVSTSIDGTNTINALREIYKEVNKMKEGITEEELSFAKSSLIKKYPSNFETYRQTAANISTKVIHNLPDDYFETYIEKLNSINLNSVNKVAFNSIQPEKLFSILVGDSKKILNQISENEFGEIIFFEFDDLFK